MRWAFFDIMYAKQDRRDDRLITEGQSRAGHGAPDELSEKRTMCIDRPAS